MKLQNTIKAYRNTIGLLELFISYANNSNIKIYFSWWSIRKTKKGVNVFLSNLSKSKLYVRVTVYHCIVTLWLHSKVSISSFQPAPAHAILRLRAFG